MTNLENLKNTKVYVLGCEKYENLLVEFAERFEKHWGGEFTSYISKTPIEKWSDGVIDFLNQINDEYFILLHEDFYQTAPADLKQIDYLIGEAKKRKADRVSLMGNHSPERVEKSDGLWRYKPNQPYMVSFEASIQRREYLLEHLRPGWNPWEGERVLCRRVPGEIFCADKPCIFYGDKLRGGKLVKEPINVNIL